MAAHQGANRHAFLEEDDDGGLTVVRVNLDLLVSRVTPNDQPMGHPLPPLPFHLVSDGRLSERELNHVHPQCASALLIQALGFDNSPWCTQCQNSSGPGPD